MQLTNHEKEIQSKYAGLSYDELVGIAETTQMSDIEFIIAQPVLLQDFKEYLTDHEIEEYNDKIASAFIVHIEKKLTSDDYLTLKQ